MNSFFCILYTVFWSCNHAWSPPSRACAWSSGNRHVWRQCAWATMPLARATVTLPLSRRCINHLGDGVNPIPLPRKITLTSMPMKLNEGGFQYYLTMAIIKRRPSIFMRSTIIQHRHISARTLLSCKCSSDIQRYRISYTTLESSWPSFDNCHG